MPAYVSMYLFDQMPAELRQCLNYGTAGFPAHEIFNLYRYWKQAGLEAAIEHTKTVDQHVSKHFNRIYQERVQMIWK